MEQLGAPPNWQVISLGRGCERHGIVQHETLHALGVAHEMSRSDRDDFIKINLENVKSNFVSAFMKIPERFWIDSGHPFEIDSIMMYGEKFFHKNGRKTIEMLTDTEGKGYEKQWERVTTTDALQLQWDYCRDRPGFEFKPTLKPSMKQFNLSSELLHFFCLSLKQS